MKTACPLDDPTDAAPYSGALEGAGDFYVFYANAGTQISISLTDTDLNPLCTVSYVPTGYSCGALTFGLLTSKDTDDVEDVPPGVEIEVAVLPPPSAAVGSVRG